MKIFSILIFGLTLFFLVCAFALADFTSTSFQLENPINIIEGGQSSSSSFQYISNTGQLTSGQSTSSSFAQNAGFLYFPTATSPVVQATPGNAQVALSWSAATGTFANVTSYRVGTGTVSGNLSFEDVGSVTSFTKTSVSNGTQYFFKVRSYAAGILLSESAEVNATPVAPAGGGGGGGGGGGSGSTSGTNAIFSGRAYPRSTVTLLKDAQIAASTTADNNANFRISLSGLSGGNYIFSVYSEDNKGVRSSLLTFPVSITTGATTNIGGIFIAPTIAVDKSEVRRGDNIAIFGQSAPASEITISVNSHQEFFHKVNSDSAGVYLLNFDTSVLEVENHQTKSKAAVLGEISSFSKSVSFIVGSQNLPLLPGLGGCPAKADLNSDCRVNLVDFSIAAFWYNKPLNSQTIILEQGKLNGDGKINLVDFSIMAYYWTG